MKPSDFILNSDYLSIAQTNRIDHTFVFANGTLQPYGQSGDYTDQSVDLTVPIEPGAIDRVLIKVGNKDFYVGSQASLNPSSMVYGFFDIIRVDKNTLRGRMVLENVNSSASSYPALSIRVKVTSFRPPNIL